MDISTLLNINALLSSAAALVMFVFLRTRKTYPGFGYWTAGLACLAVGAAMLVPGALAQSWWVRVMRNAMLLGGLLLLLRGMILFRGLQVSYRWEAGLACLFFCVFGYFSLDAAQLDARIIVYCLFAGALCIASAAVTLRARPAYFGSSDIMLASWMLIYGGLSFVRMVQELGAPGVSTAFEVLRGFGSYYAMAQTLTVQLVALTLISMNSQRIEHEFMLGEASLAESEAWIRSIGDNVPDGFVYLFHIREEKSYFSYISAGVEKMFGMSPADVLADAGPFFAMMAPESLAQYQEDEARCLREGSEYSGVLRFNKPDGKELWLHVRSAPTSYANGAVAWAGVAVDITKLKAAEGELERHRNHLEEMVDERTNALVEAKLAAEAANLAKSSFLTNMSHEIRTPLNAIAGMAYVIRREPLSATQTDGLNKLQSAARHLGATINDILDLSKIEANQLVLEDRPVLLAPLLEGIANMLRQAAAEKGLQLRLEVAPLPAGLVGDSTRLGQALLNYASNAVKFTDRGSVTLRCRLESESPDAVVLRFEVQDTGVGIAPDQQAQLFSPFVQADPTITRKYGGTGLGLAITKRLVHAMGGAVGVLSAVGRGSTFWFTARLRKGAGTASPAGGLTTPDALDHLKSEYAGRRVLLAEDDEFSREVGKILLEDAGLAVDVAEDGQQAVDMASRNAYALILMDMQMPQLDGLEATRRIRSAGAGGQVPIVALTANAFADQRLRCLEAGMDDFLTKPVDPALLYPMLLRQLGRPEA